MYIANYNQLLNHVGKALDCTPDAEYYSFFGTFDIETTVVENENNAEGAPETFNFPYIWQLCIDGHVVTGRHINGFIHLVSLLNKILCKKIVVYVHNLQYEYFNLVTYLKQYFNLTDVFFKNTTHPFKFTIGNIEFRCSLLLTRKPLSALLKEIGMYKPDDFDYTKKRHSNTKLTAKEMFYARNDVYGLWVWLKNEAVRYSRLNPEYAPFPFELPMSQTGYIRRVVIRDFSKTEEGKKHLRACRYKREKYEFIHAAFRGGNTQSAPWHLLDICYDVVHNDFTSAYPAQIVLKKFPVGGFWEVKTPSMKKYAYYRKRDNAVIFDVTLKNIAVKKNRVSYIPLSHCSNAINYNLTNGRVEVADELTITITHLDYEIIQQCYSFDSVTVNKMMCSLMDYLPQNLVDIVYNAFCNKTSLKGVEDAKEEYAHSKEIINAIFGISATQCVHNNITTTAEGDPYVDGNHYKVPHVLPYEWGVYITAWTRYELFKFINFLGEDFIYCDTDSIFAFPSPEYEAFIKTYNEDIKKQLKRRGVDAPKNPAGEPQYLGEFTAEDDCDLFMTCGAKRYVYREKGKQQVDMVFSGLPNTKANHRTNTPAPIVEYLGGNTKVFEYLQKNIDKGIIIPYNVIKKMGKRILFEKCHGSIDDGQTIQNVENGSSLVLFPQDNEIRLERSLLSIFYGR